MTTRIVDVNSAVLPPEDSAVARPALERLWMATLTALSAYERTRTLYLDRVGVEPPLPLSP